ncbi:unnamed protein product [Cylindrotheca closterium]|uniref:EamA domain-containing protein n=1 Tax=Cylindrotheca closterium TaxID=2856 RepID=A0AAD2JLG1_9STRA|nr:unnamed protein product [Cylindrotheca closterium]
MPTSSISSYSLGLVFILLVSLIWAAASILVQYLYANEDFDSPFLLTYIGVSLFTLLLPLQWTKERCRGPQQPLEEYQSVPSNDDDGDEEHNMDEVDDDEHDDEHDLPPSSQGKVWTTRDHMVAAAKIAPVWFISNYAYNSSLRYTSITSSTVLASTGSLFTFLFALLFKDEHFSCFKLMGVGLGMMGSIMTGLHDIHSNNGDDATNSPDTNSDDLKLFGDGLGLLSAVGYGGYAVMIRILCPKDESLMSMELFLGFVGLFNMVVLSPIAIWQSATTAVISAFVLVSLLLKGLFDNVLSDYLWARAVVLTSATVATVGLGLTIPLAFLSDVAMGKPNVLDVSSIFGAFAVLAGFILVNIGQKEVDGEDSTDDHQQDDIHQPQSMMQMNIALSEEEESHEGVEIR